MVEFLVIRTAVGLSVLIFLATMLGVLCNRYRIPSVVGQIMAGVIFGPAALGQFIQFLGGPLIELNETLLTFAEMGGIIILFSAGLEFTFKEFRAVGKPSFTVGGMGVIIPFLLGYVASIQLGYEWQAALLIGSALTATSIAVTVKTLEEMGQLQTEEAKITINAAVIDDVLGLSVLSVIISITQVGLVPSPITLAFTVVKAVGLWFILLLGAVYILPRLIRLSALLKSEGALEVTATASCFGFAGLAAVLQLSPIVGAFAAGMAIAGSGAVKRVRDFVRKLTLVFGPLFFAATGAYLNPAEVLNIGFITFSVIFVVAVFSKIFGCGLPAAYFLKDMNRGLRVGIGMTSRGEVGFIIAGIGLAAGIIGSNAYAALLTVIMATTILTPMLLQRTLFEQIRYRVYWFRRRREEFERRRAG